MAVSPGRTAQALARDVFSATASGLLACLVHSVLGVSEEDIIEDYLFTNEAAQHINACNQIASAMWFEELRIRDPRRYQLMIRRPELLLAPLRSILRRFHFRNRLPANAQHLLDSWELIHVLSSTLAGDAETPLWEDVNVVSDPDAIKRSMVHREIMEYVLHEVLEKDFKRARASFCLTPRGVWRRESLFGVDRLHREACTAPASGR